MPRERGIMVDTCCGCIGLRTGTIIITALIFIEFSMFIVDILRINSMTTVFTVYTPSFVNNTNTETKTEIDGSPQGLDYIFVVFLPVVTLAMLLSAIFRKSEILYYALIAFIILLISLIVYSSVGEEKGCWFQFKFPSTMYDVVKQTHEVPNKLDFYAWPKSVSSVTAVTLYVTLGYYLFVVYSYVQQLRQVKKA